MITITALLFIGWMIMRQLAKTTQVIADMAELLNTEVEELINEEIDPPTITALRVIQGGKTDD